VLCASNGDNADAYACLCVARAALRLVLVDGSCCSDDKQVSFSGLVLLLLSRVRRNGNCNCQGGGGVAVADNNNDDLRIIASIATFLTVTV
jgi:hypothetical protein